MTYFRSNEALTLEFPKNFKSITLKSVFCILCSCKNVSFMNKTFIKLNWTCSFKFSAFETQSFYKTIHPWKPDVFHENHVLELKCTNFDVYGCFIPIAPITILFPPIQWIVEPSQVRFFWFGCFYSKPLYVGYKTWISTWLSRSWETIEANNGMEELNKPPPWSLFEDLCPKHGSLARSYGPFNHERHCLKHTMITSMNEYNFEVYKSDRVLTREYFSRLSMFLTRSWNNSVESGSLPNSRIWLLP